MSPPDDTGLSLPDRCLTPHELAARWRCRPSTIRSMVRSGALAAFQLNDRIRIPPESYLAAERQTLAIKPRRARRREQVDLEIENILR